MKVKVAQLCLTLCDSLVCIVHGILQARILEWVAFPSFRGSSQPRDGTQVSCIAGRFFTSWATREKHIDQINFMDSFWDKTQMSLILKNTTNKQKVDVIFHAQWQLLLPSFSIILSRKMAMAHHIYPPITQSHSYSALTPDSLWQKAVKNPLPSRSLQSSGEDRV